MVQKLTYAKLCAIFSGTNKNQGPKSFRSKKTNKQTDAQTDTTDSSTFSANTVSNNAAPRYLPNTGQIAT